MLMRQVKLLLFLKQNQHLKTLRKWIFIKTSGNIDGFWEVNVAELADKTYVDNAVQEATPVKGVDYWTEEDKAEIKMYVEDAILGGAW